MSREQVAGSIRVLVVDDEPDYAEMTAAFLERIIDSIDIETAADADEGLDSLASTDQFDVVVSDYSMPGKNGLEFLESARSENPDIPFILFTGKGSEEIASQAISAGVTDYIQKTGGEEQYERLANRIIHATRASTAERDAAQAEAHLQAVAKSASDVILTIDESSTIQFASPAIESVFGYTPEEVIDESLTMLIPERFRDQHSAGIQRYLRDGEPALDWTGVEFPGLHKNDYEVPVSISFGEFTRNGNHFFTGIIRDISDQKQRTRELEDAREFIENALNIIDDVFFAFDETGSLLRWNKRLGEVTGYTDEEIGSMHPVDFFADKDSELIHTAIDECLETGLVRVEADAVTKDGVRIPYEFRGRTLTDSAGNQIGIAGIGRDLSVRKQREDRLAGFNEMLAEFLLADERETVCDIAVETAESRLNLPVTAIGLFDDEEGILRSVARTSNAEQYLNGEEYFGTACGRIWDAFTAGESAVITDFDTDLLVEPQAATHLLVHPLGRHGVFVSAIDAPDGLTDAERNFIASVVSNIQSALDRIEHEELYRERVELLEQQNEQLDRQNRINDIIRRIDQTLVGATTRGEIERTVCEELVAEGPYRFAWIGEYESTTETIEPRESAGEHSDYLDVISAGNDENTDDSSPTARTIHTHESSVINEMLAEPPLPPWRKHALDRGFRSCIAIPLIYRDRLFGVLNLYSDHKDAFDELEQTVLEELGQTKAHAISAIESTRALVSDKIVELEFEIDPGQIPFLQPVSESPDCELELESIVPDEETYRVFLTLRNVDDDVPIKFEESSVIRSCTEIAERDGTRVIECSVTSDSLIAWLLDHNAVPRSISIDEQATITVELSQEADVREFVELFQSAYTRIELIARRERERSAQTRMAFQSELEDRLTPRQQEILRTAYFSGFFTTPRERTGREIASSIGISQPTFSDHLRAALRKMLGLLYETEPEESR